MKTTIQINNTINDSQIEVWNLLRTSPDQLRVLKLIENILDNDYRKPSMEQALVTAQRYVAEENNNASNDWERVSNKTVDFRSIWKRMPKHRYCDLVIRRSEVNPTYTGLYCQQHNKLLQWVNDYQIYWLMHPSDTGIINETNNTGRYL